MDEEIKFLLDSLKEQMQKAVNHLEQEFRSIRAGKANPAMLSTVMVDYYGSQTPLSQVANVTAMDAQTLSIQPWEKNMLGEIEKAIHAANLGFNPNNNGDFVIISVPALTEERRKDLVKQAKAEVENTKVSLRNERREALHELKTIDLSEDLHKNVEIDIQNVIDTYSKKVEDLFLIKEKEIMTV